MSAQEGLDGVNEDGSLPYGRTLQRERTVAADALANRRRCAANFQRVLCLSEEGDHLLMWLSAHQTHKLNKWREHFSSL